MPKIRKNSYLIKILELKDLFKLFYETGTKHIFRLSILSVFTTISELGSINLLISLLFLSNNSNPYLKEINASITFTLIFLISLTLIRCISQILISNYRENLRSKFTSKLKINFLESLFESSLNNLRHISRGEILGLITDDIDRTTLALDNGMLFVQSLISLMNVLLDQEMVCLQNFLILIT